MSSKLINDSFDEMINRYSKTVWAGNIPQRYHETAPVTEANTVYHFLQAMETVCDLSRAYLEFSSDGEESFAGKGTQRVDGVIVSPNTIYLVEAKSTLDKESWRKFKGLNLQAATLEDSNHSLRKNLCSQIITPVNQIDSHHYNIQEIWGVVLADTFNPKLEAKWNELSSNTDYSILGSYEYRSQINSVYSNESKHWWHLIGWKKIADNAITPIC